MRLYFVHILNLNAIMTHLILKRRSAYTLNKLKETVQPFNHLLVLDFEATCDRNQLLIPQEIIEFPCVVVRTQDWKITNSFHKYIKPRIHPQLTSFCTELTGIMQETVDDESYFPETFSKFCNWLSEGGYLQDINKNPFVTCGDWDLKVMLPQQCALDKLPVPEYFGNWIDLKRTFSDTTEHYPRSLTDMLKRLNIVPQGKLHSGIHDVHNMIKVLQSLSTHHNVKFKITSV